MLSHWLGAAQKECGLSSKAELDPEAPTVGEHQLTALFTGDPHLLSRKEIEQRTSTAATILNKGDARRRKMLRVFFKVTSRKSRLDY